MTHLFLAGGQRSFFVRSYAILLLSGGLLASAPTRAQNADPALPSDSAYVQVSPDGHLQLDGKRIRFWSMISNFQAAPPAAGQEVKPDDGAEVRTAKIAKRRQDTAAFAQRTVDLGFNMTRVWDSVDFTKPYTMGDGSPQDMLAYALNEMDKKGVKVWFSPMGNHVGVLQPEDVDVVKDPATAKAWSAATEQIKGRDIRGILVNAWDERTEAVRLKRMKAIADFRNLYKGGLRLADDPQIAVWELSNEEWWFSHMVNGDWQGLPKFFRDELSADWHAYLKAKYHDDDGLKAAWQFLFPGESLEKGTVLLAPLAKPVDNLVLNDVNPQARAALTAKAQGITRDQCARARGADVIEFFVEKILALKQHESATIKTWGKSCQLSPCVFDTGDGYRIQTVYLQQHADAVSMCTYVDGYGKDTEEPHFPWYSGLEEQPRMAGDVPWVEIGKVPNKPYFVYETQIMDPAKYRAEYPYRLAALGAIQDWDIVSWHIFPNPVAIDSDTPYSQALQLSNGGFTAEGFHYRFDEVQMSAMKAASDIFRNGEIKTVDQPTTVTWGSESLYDPASMDYGKSFGEKGPQLSPTTYRYGLRMSVDPKQADDKVEGPLVMQAIHTASPISPTPEIAYDWRAGNLKLDSSSAATYAGFLARSGGSVQFNNGLKLDQVEVHNPDGIPFPVGEDEKYIAFGAVSDDGLPLDQSHQVTVSLVSTSFNTGFKIDPKNFAAGKMYDGMVSGQAPVLVARVSGTITAPQLKGMDYQYYDWNMHPLEKGHVDGDTIVVPADRDVFFIRLTR